MNAIATITLPTVQRQADTDEQVIGMWLHGKAETTQAIYRLDIDRFVDSVQKPLNCVTLADIQRYADSLEGLAAPTRARMLACVKSLFSFACKIGYLAFNPATPVALPKLRNQLAQRILGEESVMRMLALETDPRNHCLLRLLYAAVRVVEGRQQLVSARNVRVRISNQIRSAEEALALLQTRNVHGEPPELKQSLIAAARTKLEELQAKHASLTTQPLQSELEIAA